MIQPMLPLPVAAGVGPALDLLAAIRAGRLGDDSWIVSFIHFGEPTSKARARWSPRNNRTYTPAKTVRAQDALADRFEEAMAGRVLEGNVAIAAVFYRPNHQRVDADNLMKLVLDAATDAGAWLDDSQVTAQAAVVELDADAPRTLIAIGPTDSTLQRGPRMKPCPRCGNEFAFVGTKPRIYCSRACAQPRAMAKCARCETPFHRAKAAQRYCSKACAQQDPLVRQKAASQRPGPTCETCGGPVSRREYRRCASCAPKGRQVGSKNKPKDATGTPGVEIRIEAIA